MFSGIGLFFGFAAAVMLLLQADRRRDLLWLAAVAAAFAAWYLAIGRHGTPPNPPPSAANLTVLPVYVVWGLGASMAGIVGLGGAFGPLLLVLAAAGVALAWRRRSPDPLALGVAAGLVALYAVTGLTRGQFGYQQSGAGRYVYVGAVFWLILLADVARSLPWRGTWRPAAIACLFLVCFNSGVLLFGYAAAKTVQMERETADLQALHTERSDPCLNRNASVDRFVMPQVAGVTLYYRAVDRYGDPAGTLPVRDRLDFAAAIRNLVVPGCK